MSVEVSSTSTSSGFFKISALKSTTSFGSPPTHFVRSFSTASISNLSAYRRWSSSALNFYTCVNFEKGVMTYSSQNWSLALLSFLSRPGDAMNGIWGYSKLSIFSSHLRSLKIFSPSSILSMILYPRYMYESKCSTYILNSKDFMKYTIIDVTQDVEDPIFVDKIKTTQLEWKRKLVRSKKSFWKNLPTPALETSLIRLWNFYIWLVI